MGITAYDVDLLLIAMKEHPGIKSVCELGSQNLYLNNEKMPPFASEWYEKNGMRYTCIDLAGDNNAAKIDLSMPHDWKEQFDLVTDFGTSEHVVQMEKVSKVAFHEGHINSIYPDGVKDAAAGFYNCWKNKHELLKAGGLMLNVNPKTGNWPGHGYHYITKLFAEKLAVLCGYEIVRIGEHAAMGNIKDGWNVHSILRKKEDKPFISFEQFQTLDIHQA